MLQLHLWGLSPESGPLGVQWGGKGQGTMAQAPGFIKYSTHWWSLLTFWPDSWDLNNRGRRRGLLTWKLFWLQVTVGMYLIYFKKNKAGKIKENLQRCFYSWIFLKQNLYYTHSTIKKKKPNRQVYGWLHSLFFSSSGITYVKRLLIATLFGKFFQ